MGGGQAASGHGARGNAGTVQVPISYDAGTSYRGGPKPTMWLEPRVCTVDIVAVSAWAAYSTRVVPQHDIDLNLTQRYAPFVHECTHTQINMFEGQICTPLCHRTYKKNDPASLKKFKQINRAIQKDYMHHWWVWHCSMINGERGGGGWGGEIRDSPWVALLS